MGNMSKCLVLKSNKADSLIKKENLFDKEVNVLSSYGYNISNKNDVIYIHLSCSDYPYILACKHNDNYPLRNLQCKFHCFYTDFLNRVSTCEKQKN